MHTIKLYGGLRDAFPEADGLEWAIASPAEAVRALEANFPGVFAYLRSRRFHVVHGDLGQPQTPECRDFTEEMLAMPLDRPGRSRVLHLLPAVEGSGGNSGKGIFATVLGAALVGAAIFFSGGVLAAPAFTVLGASVSWGQVAVLGAGLLLQGAAALLAPTPKSNYSNRNSADDRASFVFNGPVNVSEAGSIIPVVYGQMRVGSVVLSGALAVEDHEDSYDAEVVVQDNRYRPRAVSLGTSSHPTVYTPPPDDSTAIEWWITYTVSATIPRPGSGQQLVIQLYNSADALIHTATVNQGQLPYQWVQTSATVGERAAYAHFRTRYKREAGDGTVVLPVDWRLSNRVDVSLVSSHWEDDTEVLRWGSVDDPAYTNPNNVDRRGNDEP